MNEAGLKIVVQVREGGRGGRRTDYCNSIAALNYYHGNVELL